MNIRDLLIHVGVKADTAKLRQIDSGISNIKSGMFALVGATAAATFGIKKLFEAGAENEMTRVAFSTMLGDLDKANSLMKDMRKFSLETPFNFKETEDTVKMMLAMGSSYENVLEETRMLGDVSSALNVPMSRLAHNFGQVRNMGKLMGHEIKDFTTAGVPILEVLGKRLGKTKSEITDMASKGQISFEDTVWAFKAMTSEGGQFNDMLAKSAKTAKGLASNIGVLVDFAMRDIGEEINDGVLKDLLQNLFDWGKENDNVKKSLEGILKVSLGIGAAFALWGLARIGMGLNMVIAGLTGMGNAAMVANGKMLLGGLAVMAGFALLYLAIDDIYWTFENPKNKTILRDFINSFKKELPEAFHIVGRGFEMMMNQIFLGFTFLRKMFKALGQYLTFDFSGALDTLKTIPDDFKANFEIQSEVWNRNKPVSPTPTPVQTQQHVFGMQPNIEINVNGAESPEKVAQTIKYELGKNLMTLQMKSMGGVN